MKSSYFPRLISLFLADIIPAVTVTPNPKGFTIATTQSPTLALSESAKVTAFKLSLVLILITAISLVGSVPKTFASYSLPLVNFTKIPSAL